MEIWLADADGSKPVPLTHGPGNHQGSPRWSPDGQRIAFDSRGEDGHWDIWTIDADGGTPRRLTQDPGDENMPSWSRDGRFITSSQGGPDWRIPAAGERGTAHAPRRRDSARIADGRTLCKTVHSFADLRRKRPPEVRNAWCRLRAAVCFTVGPPLCHLGRQTDDAATSLVDPMTDAVNHGQAGHVGGITVSRRQDDLYTRQVAAHLMMMRTSADHACPRPAGPKTYPGAGMGRSVARDAARGSAKGCPRMADRPACASSGARAASA